jgi:UDP-N-acetyl-alpha-D-muramoyl-L-alanyl-L-glutamate epimerase
MQKRHKTYLELREKYAFFSYDSYDYTIDNQSIRIYFHFSLADEIHFHPQIEIPFNDTINTENLSVDFLQNAIFHIGMVELISYWKAAAPKRLIIRPHKLNEQQIAWWKKLYFHGLGEFFYVNGITTTIEEFMQIETIGKAIAEKESLQLSDDFILPIGGGKDSVVSLELLKETKKEIIPLIMNPRGATIETVRAGGIEDNKTILIYRKLDEQIINLNSKGFLNGHTPFSALLAFVSVLAAAMRGVKYIALSNESSANESTVSGSDINHQYSKSIAFEKDFRAYCDSYISPDIQYFSLLRPFSELKIVQLFSEYKQYHAVFRSCNVGSKENIWCGTCPKCLFSFIMLAAFLPLEEVINIFGKNLFTDPNLKNSLFDLCGINENKPFECVGTIEEVNIALQYFITTHPENTDVLIENYKDMAAANIPFQSMENYLKQYNSEHFLPEELKAVIQRKF